MRDREICCHRGLFWDFWAPVQASPSWGVVGLHDWGDVSSAVLLGAACLKRGPLLAITEANALERHLQKSQQTMARIPSQ